MLYIIPTPLGNLKDITLRSLEILKTVDVVIAENPAHSAKLFQHFQIPKKPFIQFADHNEQKVLQKVLEECKAKTCALITDAGTPGISDPGFRLVRACIESEIKVESLPGPVAAITALAGSGLPTDKFLFLGFLGKTEHKVVSALTEAKNIEATALVYESPERIVKTLTFIEQNFPSAQVVVARELTKIHEEYLRGTALDVLALFKTKKPKGEIVLLISFK